jgi:hypothetical protein
LRGLASSYEALAERNGEPKFSWKPPKPAKPPSHFPSPWTVENPNTQFGRSCFIVHDANGQALAHVYCVDEPGRGTATMWLTRDEAQRIAVNITKLPELLSKP